MRCDKTYSELWNLTENEDPLIAEAAHMAIRTLNKLIEKNRTYKHTLQVSKEAIRKNLVWAMYKDEEILYDAFKRIEKALKE